MTLVVQLMESPCVTWKTVLPRANNGCKSSVFSLRESRLNFKIYCSTIESTQETWEVSLKSLFSLGTVLIVTYVEQKNGVLKRLGHHLVFTSNNIYKTVASFGREKLTSKGISGSDVSMLFVFHYDYETCSKHIIKDVGRTTATAANSKRIRLDEPPVPTSCLQALSESIEKLFDNEEHSDVVLKCGHRSFHANRKILSARSEVFEAMFRNNMSENETGVVDIEDMKPALLEQFLRYVYSGRLHSLHMDSAFDLYRAADKYAVPSLKQKCLSFMMDNLSEKNVCQVLNLADTFGDTKLLNLAENFAASRDSFLKSDEWNSFASAHLAVAVGVYKKYVLK